MSEGVINKVAFCVEDTLILDHFLEVATRLGHENYVIVLCNDLDESRRPLGTSHRATINELKERGHPLLRLGEVLEANFKFRWTVDPYPFRLSEADGFDSSKPFTQIVRAYRRAKGKYFPRFVSEQIGLTRIRFMYGPDIGPQWSLATWNNVYHFALCHGPNDSKELRSRFGIRTYEIGYPKYDRFFEPHFDRLALKSEFGVAPGKLVLVFLTTLGSRLFSSELLDEHRDFWTRLASKYEVIVRPHPLDWNTSNVSLETIRKLGMLLDTVEDRKMVGLLGGADFIFSDSGGSGFGALYLDIPCVLLPLTSQHDLHEGSSSERLEEVFPRISFPLQIEQVENILRDWKFWTDSEQGIAVLRKEIFGDIRGGSVDRAVSAISEITAIPYRPPHS